MRGLFGGGAYLIFGLTNAGLFGGGAYLIFGLTNAGLIRGRGLSNFWSY